MRFPFLPEIFVCDAVHAVNVHHVQESILDVGIVVGAISLTDIPFYFGCGIGTIVELTLCVKPGVNTPVGSYPTSEHFIGIHIFAYFNRLRHAFTNRNFPARENVVKSFYARKRIFGPRNGFSFYAEAVFAFFDFFDYGRFNALSVEKIGVLDFKSACFD